MFIYLLYIIIGFLVLTSTIVMTLWFKTNRILNSYLVFISSVLCFYLISHGLTKWYLAQGEELALGQVTFNQTVFLLAPAVYLFFKHLLIDSKFPIKQDLIYFISPIAFWEYLGSEPFLANTKEHIVFFMLFMAYMLFFVWKSYGYLKPRIWKVKANEMTIDPIVKNLAEYIFILLLLFFVHLFIYNFASFYRLSQTGIMWIEASLLGIFLLGYFKIIFSPILFYGSFRLNKMRYVSNSSQNLVIHHIWETNNNPTYSTPKDSQIASLIQDKINLYIEKIEHLALQKHVFRNAEYSISDFSKDLNLPKYYVEFLFKYYSAVSFNEYKKIIRVYDAAQLLQENYLSTNTLESLSKFVGFASYNPFLTNFKEIIGNTPIEYHKKNAHLTQ